MLSTYTVEVISVRMNRKMLNIMYIAHMLVYIYSFILLFHL